MLTSSYFFVFHGIMKPECKVALFYFVCYNKTGENMKIAIDKKSLKAIEPNNEYIYLFNDDETLEELINLNLHCIHYKECNYVDVNLTNYNVSCFKQAKITDKDYNKMPEKHDYKFAIIVPNRNNDRGDYKGKTYLQTCIESILNQTYKNFNLIIIDDLSTDNSVKTIEEYVKKDKRIILLKNKRQRYNGGSRNKGIDYALNNLDFDYFCFLDSDDWWKHEKVLEKINMLLNNHELLTLGCEMIYQYTTGAVNYNRADSYEDLWSFNNKLWCTAWARVIRKDKIEYFCEDTLMEDRVWTYKIADNVEFENTINLKEVCYCWNRMNTNNSVSLVKGDYWNACAYCHIGHQLQFLSQIKHKEMISIIKDRIEECIRRASNGKYEQY